MYHVSAQGFNERMINVYYYYSDPDFTYIRVCGAHTHTYQTQPNLLVTHTKAAQLHA